MRRRLGLAVVLEGPDRFGHARVASVLGGRTNARHTAVGAAWRQVFFEAGGSVPDRNIERRVPPDDLRRLDIIVPNLNVAFGLPLFCDITVISPITRICTARKASY